MSVLRKNILLVIIKPHSTLQKYFNGSNLKADLYCYADIMDYIRSMHTRFTKYIHVQANNGIQETFTILDKNLREISAEELYMRKPHKGDILHIVPTIAGGGGKRGIAALIFAAIAIATFPIWAPAAGLGGLATTTLFTTAAGAVTVGGIAGTIGLNLALMGISMLLAPKASTNKSETSRDNDIFGSLVNTTSSGIAVAMHFGLVRVAGQIITGYTKTVDKAGGNTVKLTDILST